MREVFTDVIWSFNVKILSSSDKTPAVASSMSSLRKANPIISAFVTTKVGFIRFGTLEPTGNASYWRRERWTREIFRLEISAILFLCKV